MVVGDSLQSRQQKDGENTEARVRRAAIELFAKHGYSGTGIRDIARAAGITTASLYHYVENKHELLSDMMFVTQTTLNDFAVRSLESADTPEDQLGLLVSGLVAVHAANPLVARVTDNEVTSLDVTTGAHERIVALRDRYEEMWRAVLERGNREKVFAFESEQLTRLALLSMCTGMSNWYTQRGHQNLADICRHHTGIALRVVEASRNDVALTADDVAMVDLDDIPQLSWEPSVLADLAAEKRGETDD